MILAAGYGLRMRPLTLHRAKPALPLLDRPLIHHTLERLRRHGVTDVIVNLHHRPGSIRAAVGDGSRLGMRVTYSHERVVLGTGGGPRKVRAFFEGRPALLVNGDVLFDFDLGALLRRHERSGAGATLALKPNPDPRRYHPIVTGPRGWVRWVPGMRRRRSGAAHLFTGVQILDPALLERLPEGPSDSVRDLYAPYIADGGRVLGVRVRGEWSDLGHPAAYLAAQLRALARARGARGSLVDPSAVVESGVSLRSAVVGAGARVNARARVERSVLIGKVRVGRDAIVRRSIVAFGASVPEGRRIDGRVLVGRGGDVPLA